MNAAEKYDQTENRIQEKEKSDLPAFGNFATVNHHAIDRS